MTVETLLENEIEQYQERTPRSKALWEKASKVMPMGTASNSRMHERTRSTSTTRKDPRCGMSMATNTSTIIYPLARW